MQPMDLTGTASSRKADGELVSVTTATFNREKYLPLAIESVLGQTYGNLEYHIVDDGSTDNTHQVVKRYLRDGRVRYYYQDNRGQSVARNVGLLHSSGRFVCFLDSDNMWLPDKLERQLRIFKQRPEIDIVYGDGECIDEAGRVLPIPQMRRHSGYITDRLLMDNCVSFNTAMIRYHCFARLGGLDESLRRSDDYELFLRLSTEFKFLYSPECFARYRVWTDQLSANKEQRFEAVAKILVRFFERYPAHAAQRLVRKTWSHFYVRRGRHRAMNSNYSRAFLDYVRALRHCPTSVAPWRALVRLILLWE